MVAGCTVQGTLLTSTVNSRKNVDLAPDGKRIVAAQQSLNHVLFLENFFDERRWVPFSGK